MPNNSSDVPSLILALAESYSQERLIYSQLVQLAERQLQAIGVKDWNQLDLIAADQGRLVERVSQLDRKVGSLKDSLGKALGLRRVSLGSIARAVPLIKTVGWEVPFRKLERAVDDCLQVVQHLQELEDKAEKNLRKSTEMVGGETRQSRMLRTAAKAYNRRMINPKFIDKQR